MSAEVVPEFGFFINKFAVIVEYVVEVDEEVINGEVVPRSIKADEPVNVVSEGLIIGIAPSLDERDFIFSDFEETLLVKNFLR